MFWFALVLLLLLTLGIVMSTIQINKWGEHVTFEGKEYLYGKLASQYINYLIIGISLLIYLITGHLNIVYASICGLMSVFGAIKQIKKKDSALPIADISLIVFYGILIFGK